MNIIDGTAYHMINAHDEMNMRWERHECRCFIHAAVQTYLCNWGRGSCGPPCSLPIGWGMDAAFPLLDPNSRLSRPFQSLPKPRKPWIKHVLYVFDIVNSFRFVVQILCILIQPDLTWRSQKAPANRQMGRKIGQKVSLLLWKDRLDSVPAAEMSERLPLGGMRNM